MSNRIFSFSVKPKDKETIALVESIQLLSIQKGVKFSFMVIEGLKLYLAKEGIANGKIH
jgi:hypothetical protein